MIQMLWITERRLWNFDLSRMENTRLMERQDTANKCVFLVQSKVINLKFLPHY